MRRFDRRPTARDEGLPSAEIRELWAELALPGEPGPYGAAEFSPPADLLETERTIELRVDVPGIPTDRLRVVFKPGLLVVAGSKPPSRPEDVRGTAFHLLERESGWFVRGVRLVGAVDVARATATLHAGELRVTVPKIGERRGGTIHIPIRQDAGPSPS